MTIPHQNIITRELERLRLTEPGDHNDDEKAFVRTFTLTSVETKKFEDPSFLSRVPFPRTEFLLGIFSPLRNLSREQMQQNIKDLIAMLGSGGALGGYFAMAGAGVEAAEGVAVAGEVVGGVAAAEVGVIVAGVAGGVVATYLSVLSLAFGKELLERLDQEHRAKLRDCVQRKLNQNGVESLDVDIAVLVSLSFDHFQLFRPAFQVVEVNGVNLTALRMIGNTMAKSLISYLTKEENIVPHYLNEAYCAVLKDESFFSSTFGLGGGGELKVGQGEKKATVRDVHTKSINIFPLEDRLWGKKKELVEQTLLFGTKEDVKNQNWKLQLLKIPEKERMREFKRLTENNRREHYVDITDLLRRDILDLSLYWPPTPPAPGIEKDSHDSGDKRSRRDFPQDRKAKDTQDSDHDSGRDGDSDNDDPDDGDDHPDGSGISNLDSRPPEESCRINGYIKEICDELEDGHTLELRQILQELQSLILTFGDSINNGPLELGIFLRRFVLNEQITDSDISTVMEALKRCANKKFQRQYMTEQTLDKRERAIDQHMRVIYMKIGRPYNDVMTKLKRVQLDLARESEGWCTSLALQLAEFIQEKLKTGQIQTEDLMDLLKIFEKIQQPNPCKTLTIVKAALRHSIKIKPIEEKDFVEEDDSELDKLEDLQLIMEDDDESSGFQPSGKFKDVQGMLDRVRKLQSIVKGINVADKARKSQEFQQLCALLSAVILGLQCIMCCVKKQNVEDGQPLTKYQDPSGHNFESFVDQAIEAQG